MQVTGLLKMPWRATRNRDLVTEPQSYEEGRAVHSSSSLNVSVSVDELAL
jgi:hypothetical protein